MHSKMKKFLLICIFLYNLHIVQGQSCTPVSTISPSGTVNICDGSNTTLTAPASNVWMQKADQLGIRYGAVAFSIGSKGYVGTGRDAARKKDFWEYDPATNVWTQKADFGGTARYYAAGFSINGKGYIGTGRDVSGKKNDFWEYDPSTNTWTQKANFGGTARDYAVGFSIGSKGYIGTGSNGTVSYKDFWEYDPSLNSWMQKADFGGTARISAVGFNIGSKGYIGTGYDVAYKKDFWEYDPSVNGWIQKADFGGTVREAAAGFSIGTRGYIGAGWDGSGETKDFWEYDQSLNSWTQKANFGGTARELVIGFSIGAKGYLGTGWDGTYKKDIWEYDPGYTYAWSTGASTQSINVSTYGNYTVTLTNILGCSNTSSATVVNLSNTWIGGGTNNWNTATNWSCGTVPNNANVNAIINNAASPMPVLNSDITVRNLVVNGTATVTLNSNQFTIAGSMSGGGSITGSPTSSLVLNGAAGNVNFTSGSQTLKNFTLGNNASATLNNTLNIIAGASAGTVTVNSGAVLNTGGNLVLQSDASGTARIGASDGAISGDVTIERYTPARRAWRLLTVPFHNSATTTISQAWQEAQQATTIPPPAYTPGSGTLITYSNTAVNGYDKGTTNNPTLKYFSSGSWIAPTATTIPLNTYPGYMLFVRGDRNFVIGGPAVPATVTTLRPKGPVNINTQTINNLVGTGFQVVGNPFASAINFHTVTKSGLGDVYYLWDPKVGGINGVGGFVTFAWNSTNSNYDVTVNGPGSSSLPNDGTIESGAAFVVNFTGAGNLQVKENDKISTSSADAFGRPIMPGINGPSSIRAVLNSTDNTGNISLLDAVLINYSNVFSNELDNEDASKLNNFSENIAVKRNGQMLAIERRQIIGDADTIFFNLSQLRQKEYSLQLTVQGLQQAGLYVLLEDKFTGKKVPVSLFATDSYTFIVNSEAGSYAADRLRLLVKKNPVFIPAFYFTSVSIGSNAVQWEVNAQAVAGEYFIEQSVDGVRFFAIGSVTAEENSAIERRYESSSIQGDKYYRIQFRPYSGETKYSAVVKASVDTKRSIAANPNPVEKRELNLYFHNFEKGNYTIRLVNQQGNVVQTISAIIEQGATMKKFFLLPAVTPGIYIAEAVNEKNKIASKKILVQ